MPVPTTTTLPGHDLVWQYRVEGVSARPPEQTLGTPAALPVDLSSM